MVRPIDMLRAHHERMSKDLARASGRFSTTASSPSSSASSGCPFAPRDPVRGALTRCANASDRCPKCRTFTWRRSTSADEGCPRAYGHGRLHGAPRRDQRTRRSKDGFVWRLHCGEGNNTYPRPYDDERVIVNMSVWETIERRSIIRADGPFRRGGSGRFVVPIARVLRLAGAPRRGGGDGGDSARTHAGVGSDHGTAPRRPAPG